MQLLNRQLRGSTLVETLVMMLVAGIIFLSVMDGLTLFTHLQVQRTEAILKNGRQAAGYYRIASLIENADSAGCYGELVELFRGGERSSLALCDSAIVYRYGAFCDTLIKHICQLQLTHDKTAPDTLKIEFAAGFTAAFALQESLQEQYTRSLEQIEHEYGYDQE